MKKKEDPIEAIKKEIETISLEPIRHELDLACLEELYRYRFMREEFKMKVEDIAAMSNTARTTYASRIKRFELLEKKLNDESKISPDDVEELKTKIKIEMLIDAGFIDINKSVTEFATDKIILDGIKKGTLKIVEIGNG